MLGKLHILDEFCRRCESAIGMPRLNRQSSSRVQRAVAGGSRIGMQMILINALLKERAQSRAGHPIRVGVANFRGRGHRDVCLQQASRLTMIKSGHD